MKTDPPVNPSISDKIITSIWKEEPRTGNPFYPEKSLCHGYDYYGELMGRVSFPETVHLMFRGELPSERELARLNLVMVAAANPGPRMWCTRAAMSAAIGKTSLANCFMAGIAGLGGAYFGAQDVEDSMALFQQALQKQRETKATLSSLADDFNAADGRVPGFGLFFSERDGRAEQLIKQAQQLDLAGEHTELALKLEIIFSRTKKLWLTLPGAVAALLSDAGYSPAAGAAVFLLAGSTGLLAHAVEQLPRNWNEYPFWWDSKKHYRYEGPSQPPSEEVNK